MLARLRLRGGDGCWVANCGEAVIMVAAVKAAEGSGCSGGLVAVARGFGFAGFRFLGPRGCG